MGCGVSSPNNGETPSENVSSRLETAIGPTVVAPRVPQHSEHSDDASTYGSMENPLRGGDEAPRVVQVVPIAATAAPVASDQHTADVAVHEWLGCLPDPARMQRLPSDRGSSSSSSSPPNAVVLAAYETLSLQSGVSSQTPSVASSLAMHVGQGGGELASQASFSDRMASIASQEPSSYHHLPAMPALVIEDGDSSDSSGAGAPIGGCTPPQGRRGAGPAGHPRDGLQWALQQL